MSDIARRIEKLEKVMSVGKERKISECIVVFPDRAVTVSEQEQRDELGPAETWLTYQEQLAAAREDQADCDYRIIMLCLFVEKELQAREFQNTRLAEEERAERRIYDSKKNG
jgi:hypothetical protein